MGVPSSERTLSTIPPPLVAFSWLCLPDLGYGGVLRTQLASSRMRPAGPRSWELPRTPLGRSSQNSPCTHSGEYILRGATSSTALAAVQGGILRLDRKSVV